jgi:hypothetical protein
MTSLVVDAPVPMMKGTLPPIALATALARAIRSSESGRRPRPWSRPPEDAVRAALDELVDKLGGQRQGSGIRRREKELKEP